MFSRSSKLFTIKVLGTIADLSSLMGVGYSQ
jgi:hypothetical protein